MGRELLADCEAFVLGRYADLLEARSVAVPVWAWTNLLAHGSEKDLRSHANTTRATSPGLWSWRAARSYLATELLTMVGRGSSLGELQHVLASLELDLAVRHDVRSWEPQRWAMAVRSALSAYERSRRP